MEGRQKIEFQVATDSLRFCFHPYILIFTEVASKKSLSKQALQMSQEKKNKQHIRTASDLKLHLIILF